MGPCAAGTAYIPGLADFVPMVKGRGSMALAGPHLVRAAVGEDVTQEELGGSRVHCRKSGVGDLEVADDPDCIEAIKTYLSYFPAAAARSRRRCASTERPDRPRRRGAARRAARVQPQALRHVRGHPPDRRRRRATSISSPSSRKTIITCLARFGGRPAGIVANQPKHLGGILDNDSADKAARFINLCNAYGIPLVYLMDVPGFMVGTKVEEAGIIRHGAKMLYATANATVPKITVVTAQGLRRRLLRDVRPRLRARPDRRLAVGRDQRDGRRGRGRDHLPQAGARRPMTRRPKSRS